MQEKKRHFKKNEEKIVTWLILLAVTCWPPGAFDLQALFWSSWISSRGHNEKSPWLLYLAAKFPEKRCCRTTGGQWKSMSQISVTYNLSYLLICIVAASRGRTLCRTHVRSFMSPVFTANRKSSNSGASSKQNSLQNLKSELTSAMVALHLWKATDVPGSLINDSINVSNQALWLASKSSQESKEWTDGLVKD